jgi:hypothetical protein
MKLVKNPITLIVPVNERNRLLTTANPLGA